MTIEEVDPVAYLSRVLEVADSAEHDRELVGLTECLPGGDDALVAFLASGFERSFDPELAAGTGGRVRFVVTSRSGKREVCLEIDEDGCRVVPVLSDPDVEIRLPLIVLLRIALKRLTGAEAYLAGAVEAHGDVVLATCLDGWFTMPASVAGEVAS
jgi:SCP-2 sterol transfer family